MTMAEMVSLENEFFGDVEIEKATHLHDEDAWNSFNILFRGVIVGSELVSQDFVRRYIANHFAS